MTETLAQFGVVSRTEPAHQQWLDETGDDLETDSGVLLYGRRALAERNVTFEVAEYAPGFVLIGDDGGGNGFLLAGDGVPGPVFQVGLGSLQPDDFVRVADTFSSWRAGRFALPAE